MLEHGSTSNVTLVAQNQLPRVVLKLGSAQEGQSRSEYDILVCSRYHWLTEQSRE